MVKVYIPGVWDLLHVGHLHALSLAKGLGDYLVVGIPDDQVVEEDKGRPPIITLQDRMTMLVALRCVDKVVAYHRLEFISQLESIQPDILAVGDTWGQDERHLAAEEWVKSNGKVMVMLPYYPHESTTDIKRRVLTMQTQTQA